MHPANTRRLATLIGAALPFVLCSIADCASGADRHCPCHRVGPASRDGYSARQHRDRPDGRQQSRLVRNSCRGRSSCLPRGLPVRQEGQGRAMVLLGSRCRRRSGERAATNKDQQRQRQAVRYRPHDPVSAAYRHDWMHYHCGSRDLPANGVADAKIDPADPNAAVEYQQRDRTSRSTATETCTRRWAWRAMSALRRRTCRVEVSFSD